MLIIDHISKLSRLAEVFRKQRQAREIPATVQTPLHLCNLYRNTLRRILIWFYAVSEIKKIAGSAAGTPVDGRNENSNFQHFLQVITRDSNSQILWFCFFEYSYSWLRKVLLLNRDCPSKFVQIIHWKRQIVTRCPLFLVAIGCFGGLIWANLQE